MFTGIIQSIGRVTAIEKKQNLITFKIESVKKFSPKIGASIAINGACMTVTSAKDNHFTFDCIAESLKLTNLGTLKINDEVNLEPALKANQELDGHLVQGHIDCQGSVKSMTAQKNKFTLEITHPTKIAKYLALKGSITINGVSLTITKITPKSFAVELIPHTLKETNLKNLQKKSKVNLEVDLLARYIERLLKK